MSKIIKAAIRLKGNIYTGFNHDECIIHGDFSGDGVEAKDIEYGFIDEDYNFYSQEQALRVANDNLPFPIRGDYLSSQDMYLIWLKEQERQIDECVELNKKLAAHKLSVDETLDSACDTIRDLKQKLAAMKKALELAVETLRYEWGRDAIKELYKQAIENLEDGNLGFDTKMAEWFEEQAKEMLKDDN